MGEEHFDFKFVFGNAEIFTFREFQIKLEIGNILDNFVFQIQIFIAVVYHFETRTTLNPQRHHWQYHFLPVKQQPGVSSFSLHAYFDVGEVWVNLGVIHQVDWDLLLVYPWRKRVEKQFYLHRLIRWDDSFSWLNLKNFILYLTKISLPFHFPFIGIAELNFLHSRYTFVWSGDNLFFKLDMLGIYYEFRHESSA